MSKIVFQSRMASKCAKEAPKEEISINSQWLTRGGFVNKLMGGVYSYLPLGLRVLQKVENIIRDEMDAMGSNEILMPSLTPKQLWDTTDRWDKMEDIMYKVHTSGDKVFGLGPTHEEVVTPLIGGFIQSYKDLPASVYQIQTKFRSEARPKSGLLRGREFRMKDMYSFHIDESDLDTYYDRAIEAYNNVFDRFGIGDKTYLTFASGGVFSKYSHEFQAITPYGEDTVYLDREQNIAVNEEVLEEAVAELGINKNNLEPVKAIEVGNIFKLSTRFPDAFGIMATNKEGKRSPIYMGCYGLGTSRAIGSIVELCHDDNGIVWPKNVAPFDVHMIVIGKDDDVLNGAKALADKLSIDGTETLIDDRKCSPGQKFAESDIIGIPYRIILSPKLEEKSMYEIKNRKTGEAIEVAQADIIETYKKLVKDY